MPVMRALLLGLVAVGLSGCLEPGGPALLTRDDNPPRVVRTLPGRNELVSKRPDLQVIFSEAMDPRSVAAGLILLAPGGGQVPVNIVLPRETPAPEPVEPEVPYTVHVYPSVPLVGDVRHTLVMTTLLSDTAGNALPAEVRVDFFTEP